MGAGAAGQCQCGGVSGKVGCAEAAAPGVRGPFKSRPPPPRSPPFPRPGLAALPRCPGTARSSPLPRPGPPRCPGPCAARRVLWPLAPRGLVGPAEPGTRVARRPGQVRGSGDGGPGHEGGSGAAWQHGPRTMGLRPPATSFPAQWVRPAPRCLPGRGGLPSGARPSPASQHPRAAGLWPAGAVGQPHSLAALLCSAGPGQPSPLRPCSPLWGREGRPRQGFFLSELRPWPVTRLAPPAPVIQAGPESCRRPRAGLERCLIPSERLSHFVGICAAVEGLTAVC